MPWGSGTKSVSSVVLVATGVSFVVWPSILIVPPNLDIYDATTQMMSLIFTTIGSAADYGTLGRWVLLTLTVICWSSQFTSISLTGEGTWRIIFFLPSETLPPLEPSRWGAAMALYMIGFITYGATLVFYAALFPRLARNTPRTRKLQGMYQAGEISVEEYEAEESLEKNRISNISTVRSWLDRKSVV